jgi:predicted dehydrogenase
MTYGSRTNRPLGVGILGAGPVTQAIHLPTLATLADRFRVTHVMDVDQDVARRVASRTGARAGGDVQTLLDDPAVDVVAVCSPHQFHADQVEAAAKAGKLAVLCEKPLATTVEQAQRIADVSGSLGVPVVVGAMHVHDPAVVAAMRAWADRGDRAALVRVAVYLPDNSEMIDVVTDVAAPRQPPAPPPDATAPDDAPEPALPVRGALLGLATHSLPLVRRFVPVVDEVVSAAYVRPFGYEVTFRGNDTLVQLLAVMPGRWRPDWSLRAYGHSGELHVEFPPSYVLAGSAVATLATPAARRSWAFPWNGYQAEWAHLSEVVRGRADLAVPVQESVDDLLYTLRLADAADALIGRRR